MEDKKKFVLGFLGLIIFIIIPLEKTLNYRKEMKLEKVKLLREEEKSRLIKKELLEEERKIEDIRLKILEKEKKEYKFYSAGDFNLYISNHVKKNNLDIVQIGRMIKDGDMSIFNYKLRGREENIFRFLISVEEENKTLLLNRPLELRKEEDLVSLQLNFTSFIVPHEKYKSLVPREKILREEIIGGELSLINENSGILKIKNKKYYVKNREILNLDNKIYEVRLKEGDIKLLQRRN